MATMTKLSASRVTVRTVAHALYALAATTVLTASVTGCAKPKGETVKAPLTFAATAGPTALACMFDGQTVSCSGSNLSDQVAELDLNAMFLGDDKATTVSAIQLSSGISADHYASCQPADNNTCFAQSTCLTADLTTTTGYTTQVTRCGNAVGSTLTLEDLKK